MGWMSRKVPIGGERAAILAELEPVVALEHGTKKGPAWYAAVELESGPYAGRIIGVVVLAERRGRELSTKVVSEDMGPLYYDAPASILELLTEPPLNEYAAGWRKKCRAAAAINATL